MASVRGWVGKHPMVAFFGLAYGYAWLLAAVMIARHWGWIAAPGWLHYLVAWGPGLAAVTVSAVMGGWQAVAALGGRIVKWRIGWVALGAAVATPLLLLVIALGGNAVMVQGWPQIASLGVMDYLGNVGVGVAALVWMASFGLGEELGWRGFAQQYLQPRMGLLKSATVIGVLWAFWHVPFFFYKDTFVAMGLLGFPLFFISIMPGAIVLGWLYDRAGGSVLAVAVWHGLFDWITASDLAEGPIAAVVTMVVIVWAILIVRAARRAEHQPGQAGRDHQLHELDELRE